MDQRSVDRDAQPDIGAYEFVAVGPSIVAASDDTASTSQDVAVGVDVSANDSDVNGDTISVVAITQPVNGSASIGAGEIVTYTPDAGYTGADGFDYWAIDAGAALAHYWGLEGDGLDAVGSSNGTLTGTTTVAGDFGSALSFDEVDDRVVVPDFSYGADWSLSFEFKADDNTGTAFQYMYSHGDVDGPNSINVWLNESSHGTDPNVLRTVVRDGDDTLDNFALDTNIAPLIGDGLWHTYTVTADSTVGLTVYVDGVQVASDATRGTGTVDPSGSAYFGARQDLDIDRFYGGSLDTVQVYDRVLSSGEIADLAAEANVATVSVTVNTAAPQTYVVNSPGDASDADTADGLCDTGGTNSESATECTLRAAIEQANASGAADTINFAIPAGDAVGGVWTIAPGSVLPEITTAVTIDGSTQPGFSGQPVIEIDGSVFTLQSEHGISLGVGSDGSTIHALNINSFPGAGIWAEASDAHTFTGNVLGLDADGDSLAGNRYGIYISGVSDSVIGGTTAAERNVISANTSMGVAVYDSIPFGLDSLDTVITGNYVGTDVTGLLDRGNARDGLFIVNGSSRTRVGGTTAAETNVLAGNGDAGVFVGSGSMLDVVVQGNIIGLGADGSTQLPNDIGVEIQWATATIVEDNVIGPQVAHGISLSSANDSVVQGNSIGTDATGTEVWPIGQDGVAVISSFSSGNLVGGTGVGDGNTIANVGGDGVSVISGTGFAQTILGNSISAYGDMAIDLGDDGRTDNDPGDGDSGPNEYLNTPVITDLTESGGTITATYDLDVPGLGSGYLVEMYSSSLVGPNGHGEMIQLVASQSVAGSGTGYTIAYSGAVGDVVTLTITEDLGGGTYGDTSEPAEAWAVSSGTVIVNSTGDDGDSTPGNGVCATGNQNSDGDPECTLRAAIEEANADPLVTTVHFAITTNDPNHLAGVWTIAPSLSQLPAITNAATLDGTTQPGYLGTPVIVIDGTTRAGFGSTTDDGLYAAADAVTISGFSVVNWPDDGVSTEASGVTFSDLWLGVLPDGTQAANTESDAVVHSGADGTVLSNIVSAAGGAGDGVIVSTSTNTTVQDSYFGTTPNYTALSPTAEALVIGDGATGVTIDGNVFGNTPQAAIVAVGTPDDIVVTSNYFGTDPTETEVMPIGSSLWTDTAATIRFGGTGAGEGNVVTNAFNQAVSMNSAFTGTISVLGNSIYGNTFGFDLENDGPTLNDAGDADPGPNGLLNFPEITSATEAAGTVTVTFDLDVPANVDGYRMELFANPSGADASGYGQGETYLGSTDVAGSGIGFTFAYAGAAGDVVTATATEISGAGFGATSEFSVAYTVGSGTVVVNSTGDDPDMLPGNGVCDTGGVNSVGADACTLRAAIEEANASVDINTIEFNIPAGEAVAGVWTIGAGSELPQILDGVVIDATTQSGWVTTPVVEIDGSSAGATSDGLRVFAADVEIRGFAITSFGADGIEVDSTASNTTIAGNHIGVNPAGAAARGNGGEGIDLQVGSGPTTVGGTAAADRNVISGNGSDGVLIWGTDGNTVVGNYIGTDVTGLVAIPNGADGVEIGGGSSNNIVGQVGAGNVLSGNTNDGIEVTGSNTGNVIQANMIGLGVNGDTAVANGRYGVVLYNGANATLVGGDATLGEGNVISANTSRGIHVDGNANPATTANVIRGNLIGTDSTGIIARPNGDVGVRVYNGANGTVIGGSAAGDRNVISGNGTDGIYLQDSGTDATVIKGNYIGVDITGDAALPNGDRGIQIESGVDATVIGGSGAGEGNVISGNGTDGIIISDGASPGTGTTGTVIEGNHIGVGATASVALGNGTTGIRITTVSTHRVGGTAAAAGNIIAHNTSAGFAISNGGNDNSVLGNAIYSNGGIGIDLGLDSFTINDAGDGDPGSNDLLNFPDITSAIESGGTVTVTFDLDVPANADGYRIEFFANPNGADATGYGEGEMWLGSSDVAGTGSGFTFVYAGGAGDVVTATATEIVGAGFGATSEFSAVEPVNVAPVAVDDPGASTSEDTPVTVDVVANDSDGDGDGLTVQSVTQPANGSVVNNGADVTYTPDADFNGTDSFTYTVTDGALTDTATVTVTVAAVNDAPVAVDDPGAGTNEDTPGTIDVLANDSDVDGDGLTVQSVTQPVNGSVVNNGTDVTYTPDADFNGTDSFTYTVTDGALTDTATVTVTVAAVNDAPVATGETASVDEDATLSVVAPGVLANDSDVDGDSLTAVLDSGPTSAASFTLNSDGSFDYTPAANFNGSDSFTYHANDGTADSGTVTVSITVNAINDAPVAVDDPAATNEDTPVTVDVLANDSDVDGDGLSVDSVTQPVNGSVVNNGTDVTYTPDADFNGTDSFTYTVTDGSLTDTATVTVTVAAVNDAPVAADDPGASTSEDVAVTVDVLANDSDVDLDVLSVDSVTQPPNGSVVNNGTDVTYTPDADWSGTDSFTYTVTDGVLTDTATVTVTVAAVNDAPVAVDDPAATTNEDTAATIDVLANDSDVDLGALSVDSVTQPVNGIVVNNGTDVTYTPDADFNGTDTFTYTITDGALTDTATVTVTVAAANDAPVAVADGYAVNEDGSLSVGGAGVLSNDGDVDGDPITAVLDSGPTSAASFTLNSDGSFDYTPDTNFNGPDSFTYHANDGTADSGTVTVSITVNAINDAPVAVDDPAATNEDVAITVDVLANDSDVESDPLSVDSVTQPVNGSVVNNGTDVTYTPDADFNGTDSFTYTVTDGVLTDTATVTVTVAAVNDAPVAVDDPAATNEDTPVTVDVLANDSDADLDSLTVDSVTQPANGSVVNNGTDVTYTPDADFNGTDSFTYTVTDGSLTDTATVTVTVAAVNDAPVAVDDPGASTNEDAPVTIDVVANDSDVDGDGLTVQSVTQPSNGSVVNNGTDVTYTPDADFNGTDTFTYTITDGALTDTATVTVTVAAVNDVPVAVDDPAATSEDTPVTVDVLANDSDADLDSLTVDSVTQPANGTVVNNGTDVTYTPDTNFNGTDSFTYTVTVDVLANDSVC